MSLRRHSLPYIDPSAPRGKAERVLLRMFSTGLMFWFEHTLFWRIVGWRCVPRLMRHMGRRAVRFPLPAGLLETKDARNGRPHRRAVVYFHDADKVTIIPAKAGMPEDPFWYENIRADPDVMFGREAYRATVVRAEDETTRLWELADQFFPPYAAYRATAARFGRTIPILRLDRR